MLTPHVVDLLPSLAEPLLSDTSLLRVLVALQEGVLDPKDDRGENERDYHENDYDLELLVAPQRVEEEVCHEDQLDREADLQEELEDICDKRDCGPHDELDEPNLEVNQVIRIDIVVDK